MFVVVAFAMCRLFLNFRADFWPVVAYARTRRRPSSAAGFRRFRRCSLCIVPCRTCCMRRLSTTRSLRSVCLHVDLAAPRSSFTCCKPVCQALLWDALRLTQDCPWVGYKPSAVSAWLADGRHVNVCFSVREGLRSGGSATQGERASWLQIGAYVVEPLLHAHQPGCMALAVGG